MAPLVQKRLILAGVFTFVFLVTAYRSFPYEVFKQQLLHRLPLQNASVDVKEISPYWFTGIALHDVTITQRGASPTTLPLKLDTLAVRLSVIPLLWGSRSFSANVEVGDGEADIDFATRKEHVSLQMDFDAFDLSKVTMLGEILPLPLLGTLDGDVDIEYEKSIYEAEGSIDLVLNDTVLGKADSKVPLGAWGSVSIDPLELGKVELQSKIEKGTAQITKLHGDGNDLRLDGSGTVKLHWPIEQSYADLQLRFLITEQYKKKSDKASAALELAQNSPELQRARTGDDWYQFTASGALGRNLSFRPAGNENFSSRKKRGSN